MPATRRDLNSVKRDLVAARTHVQEAAALARRIGDALLAERLRDITECLANELDYVEGLIARLP